MTEEAGRFRPKGDYRMVTTHAHLVDRMYFHGKQKDRYLREIAFIDELMQRNTTGRRILDVGCGTGVHVKLLRELGYDASGMDLRQQMIDVARARNPSVKLEQRDMRDSLIINEVDGITCMYGAINYIDDEEDLERAFSNFFEALNSQGVAVIDTRHWDRLDEKVYTWQTDDWVLSKRWVKGENRMESAYRVFYAIPSEGVMEMEDHMQYFQDPSFLSEKLEQAGFSKLEIFDNYDLDRVFDLQSGSHLPVLVARKE